MKVEDRRYTTYRVQKVSEDINYSPDIHSAVQVNKRGRETDDLYFYESVNRREKEKISNRLSSNETQ